MMRPLEADGNFVVPNNLSIVTISKKWMKREQDRSGTPRTYEEVVSCSAKEEEEW